MKKEAYQYDVIILGGGGAGIAALEGAKAAGARRIAIVEAQELGGECPHTACVPTKALLASAKAYRMASREAAALGVRVRGVAFDLRAAMEHKNASIQAIVGGGRLQAYVKSLGAEVIKGTAVFEDAHTIRAASRVLTGRSIVIATGTVDAVPMIAGLDDIEALHYQDAVNLPRLPKSITIIGGGPVGVEFATFFSSVGVKTVLMHMAPHILSREEEELALLAEASLKELGVHVVTNAKTLGFANEKRGTKVTYQVGKRPRQYLWTEAVFLATGKLPNVKNLAMERAKVKLDKNGKISLNDKLQTSAKHIFLAGDVSGRMMFTHTAHYEGYIAGWNAVRPKEAIATDLTVIPRVTFCDPELASVGLTQAEAVKRGLDMLIYRSPLHVLARAAVENRQTGMVKVLVEKKTEKILGAHMLGERAGEVIHELALAMRHELPFSAVRGGIRAYPTYSEVISALEL